MDKLKYYRKKIDNIDKSIVKLLILRFNLVKQIANYKKAKKVSIFDKKRESQVIKNIKKYSKKHQRFILKIFKNIIYYSREIQTK